MIGDIYDKSKVSAYHPSQEVMDFTSYVKKDYSYGHEILHKPFVELNDRSVIDDMNRGQRTFNAFVDENIENPAEAWKWRGTRSKARNKAIAMHAQITAGYIIPMFMAQNEEDEEDVDFSEVMRDVSEWMVNNSNYKSSFLMTSMGMLMNPVNYLGAEYAEVYQKVKEKTEKGYTVTEVLDDVLSGFQAPVYSADQVLISNAYEQNIQKHRCIIKRRYIEYTEAEAMYKDYEYWGFVAPGVKSVYNEDDGLFYDIKDDDHPFLVEEATYLNRRDDTQVCFINGIYMGEPDVEGNPIQHRDNRNTPKYNVIPFGYQRVNEHFFFYKSLMNSMYWDDRLIDAQYELAMNRVFLDTNMPLAVSGTDEVDSDVIFPSSVVAFKDKDTKVSQLLPPANIGNMFQAMRETERSMEEGSVSDTAGGKLPDPNQKATAINSADRNAQIMLLGVGKTLAESIVQYGSLMADIAITHLSVPQVDQMLGGTTQLKYRTMVLKSKTIKGKNLDKTLKFDEGLLGASYSEKELENRSLKLLEEVGYPDNKNHLYLINPEKFARMKYLTRVEPERMFAKNEEFMQALMSQLYAQLRGDPLVSPEWLVRKTLYAYFRGEAEEGIVKQPQMQDPSRIMGGSPPETPVGRQAQNMKTNIALKSGVV